MPHIQEDSNKYLYDWYIKKVLKLQSVKERKCQSSPNHV